VKAPQYPASDLELAGALDRFELRRRLGKGGMGTVYEAFDRERGAVVAIKLLRSVSPDGIFRFKREFRALADVSHRNLVSLRELLATGDRWALTMDLVDGVDFLRYVRGDREQTGRVAAGGQSPDLGTEDRTLPTVAERPTGRRSAPVSGGVDSSEAVTTDHRGLASPAGAPSPRGAGRAPLSSPDQLDRLRESIRQLVKGISALHASGFLHGDIKPSNVLVEPDGRVAILDFGIVRELSGGALPAGHVAGTPAYMAPEVGTGAPLTEASDWYAVGVLLFELLGGRLPFRNTALDVLETKRHRRAPALRDVAPEAPSDLCSLTDLLLARDPALRPGGIEILLRLGSDVPPAVRATHGDSLVVGRHNELATLRAHCSAAADGRARTVFVRGSSGIGKSALLAQFAREAAAGGALVLTGRCYERESVPYKAMDSAVDALAQHLAGLPEDRVAQLMPPDVQSLARLFPVLRRVSAIGDAPPDTAGGDSHELRRRAIGAFRELVSRLAMRAPVVIHIDDAQWGDEDSANLLAEVCKGRRAPPFLLVLAFRGERAPDSPFLTSLAEAVPDADELEIGPLSERDSLDLARHLLRGLGESEDLAGAVAREGEGNPMFLRQLAHHAAERSDEVEFDRVTLSQVIRGRVEELPGRARALLEALAVASEPVPRTVAAAATDNPDVRDDAARVLYDARLVRTRAAGDVERLEVYHDRIREGVLADMSEATSARWHRALAEAWEAHAEPPAETLARHWQGAGEPTRAADYYVQAGDRAAAALASNRAAALYETALALRSDLERGGEVLGKLGDALSDAGRSLDAAGAYGRAAAHAPDGEAVHYRRRVAEQLLRGDQLEAGMAALRDCLREIGVTLPRSRARLLCSIIAQRIRVRLGGYRTRPIGANATAGESDSELDLFYKSTVSVALADPLQAVLLQSRYLRKAVDAADPRHVARALATEALFECASGRGARVRAETVAGRAVALAERSGDLIASALAFNGTAFVSFMFGDFVPAQQHWSRAIEAARAARGTWWETAQLEGMHIASLFYLGKLPELVDRFEATQDEASARGDLAYAHRKVGLGCFAWLVRDQVEPARRAGRDGVERALSLNDAVGHYHALLGGVHTALYAGEGAEAYELIRGAWRRFTLTGLLRFPWNRVAALSGRGCAALAAAAAASGARHARLVRDAGKVARRLGRDPSPYARAMSEIVGAGVSRARGDDELAIARLRAAASACEAADMWLYAAAAHHQLGLVLGGEEGAGFSERARHFLEERDVVDAPALARALVPVG